MTIIWGAGAITKNTTTHAQRNNGPQPDSLCRNTQEQSHVQACWFFPISFWHSSTPALRLRLLVNTRATRWSTIALCVTRWLRRSDVLRSSRVEWVLAAGMLARWASARTANESRLLAQRRRLVDAFFETLGGLHGRLMIVP